MKEKKFNYGWIIVIYGALVMSTLHYTCFKQLWTIRCTDNRKSWHQPGRSFSKHDHRFCCRHYYFAHCRKYSSKKEHQKIYVPWDSCIRAMHFRRKFCFFRLSSVHTESISPVLLDLRSGASFFGSHASLVQRKSLSCHEHYFCRSQLRRRIVCVSAYFSDYRLRVENCLHGHRTGNFMSGCAIMSVDCQGFPKSPCG